MRKTRFLRRNRLAREVFAFSHNSQEFPFSRGFDVISEKKNLQTYVVGNGFLSNYQATVGFLAENAGFGVLVLKITKMVIFMKN